MATFTLTVLTVIPCCQQWDQELLGRIVCHYVTGQGSKGCWGVAESELRLPGRSQGLEFIGNFDSIVVIKHMEGK